MAATQTLRFLISGHVTRPPALEKWVKNLVVRQSPAVACKCPKIDLVACLPEKTKHWRNRVTLEQDGNPVDSERSVALKLPSFP